MRNALWMVLVLCCVTPLRASSVDVNGLIDILCTIESNNDVNAVGDGGRAIGVLQIWPIYVRDANRILKLRKSKVHYVLADRWDRAKSRAMARVVITHYADTMEGMARTHNGGANGRKNPKTKKYWRKIKKYLDKRK